MPTLLGCQCSCQAAGFQTDLATGTGDCCDMVPGRETSMPVETGHEEVECRVQNLPVQGKYPVTGDGNVLGVVAMEGMGPKSPQRNISSSSPPPQPAGNSSFQAVHYAYAPPPEHAPPPGQATEVDVRAFGMADSEDFLEDVDTPKASPMDNLGGDLFGSQLYRPMTGVPSRPASDDNHEDNDGYNVHSVQPESWVAEGDDMPAFEGDSQESSQSTPAASHSSALAAMLGQGNGTAHRGSRNPPSQLFKDHTDGSLPSTASYGSVPGHMSLLRPQASLAKHATSTPGRRCTPRTPFWSMPQGLGRTGPKTPARTAPFSCLAQTPEDEELEFEVPDNEIMTVPLRTKEQRVDWRDFLCEMVATKKASALYLLYDVEAEPPQYARPPPADPKRYQAVGGVAIPSSKEATPTTDQRSVQIEEIARMVTETSIPAQSSSSSETLAQASLSNVSVPATTATEDDQPKPVLLASSEVEMPSPMDEPAPAPPPQTLVAAEDTTRPVSVESAEEEIAVPHASPGGSPQCRPPTSSLLEPNSGDVMTSEDVQDGL